MTPLLYVVCALGRAVSSASRWMCLVTLALWPQFAFAQVDGHVSVMFDVLPDVNAAEGSPAVSELRTRVFVERRDAIGRHLRLNLSGYVDALVADRESGFERTAIVRPGDLYLDVVSERFELRGGTSRIVWGRLDEFQPTDVVNPIDLTRFLLEGRNEARLPVVLARGRVFLPHSSTLEGIVVPLFRAGEFDQLAEDTSPFNLLAATGADVVRQKPGFKAGNVQGGARFTSTAGRVDWAAAVYRGFRTFPIVTLVPTFAPPPLAVESYPRFTMIGGDFETVRGPWSIRGEAAAFVDDELQSAVVLSGVPGRTLDAGIGVDRKAGNYRVAGDVLWSTSRIDAAESGLDPLTLTAVADELNHSDLNLVMVVDRSFARETRTLRVFAVHDPIDGTTFARAIASFSLRDNVWLEGSGGLFAGEANDTLGRLSRRDFLYTRLKVFF